jgi:hypothetical protein
MVNDYNWTVHLIDPDQDRIKASGFESLVLTYCDRWYPQKSRALASIKSYGATLCPECLENQITRQCQPKSHPS